jgi:hypothetical protein
VPFDARYLRPKRCSPFGYQPSELCVGIIFNNSNRHIIRLPYGCGRRFNYVVVSAACSCVNRILFCNGINARIKEWRSSACDCSYEDLTLYIRTLSRTLQWCRGRERVSIPYICELVQCLSNQQQFGPLYTFHLRLGRHYAKDSQMCYPFGNVNLRAVCAGASYSSIANHSRSCYGQYSTRMVACGASSCSMLSAVYTQMHQS